MLRTRVAVLCLLISVSCLGASAWATNLTWTVTGTFDDGGTVYGTYVYDCHRFGLRCAWKQAITAIRSACTSKKGP